MEAPTSSSALTLITHCTFPSINDQTNLSSSTITLIKVADNIFNSGIYEKNNNGGYLKGIHWDPLSQCIQLTASEDVYCECQTDKIKALICRKGDNLLHVLRRYGNHMNDVNIPSVFHDRMRRQINNTENEEQKKIFQQALNLKDAEGLTFDELTYVINPNELHTLCERLVTPDYVIDLFLRHDIPYEFIKYRAKSSHVVSGARLVEEGDSLLHLLARKLNRPDKMSVHYWMLSLITLATIRYNQGGCVFLNTRNRKQETFLHVMKDNPDQGLLIKLFEKINTLVVKALPSRTEAGNIAAQAQVRQDDRYTELEKMLLSAKTPGISHLGGGTCNLKDIGD